MLSMLTVADRNSNVVSPAAAAVMDRGDEDQRIGCRHVQKETRCDLVLLLQSESKSRESEPELE